MSTNNHRAVLLHLPQNKPIDISFHNVTFSVKTGLFKEKKTILNGVSGHFKSGELTAIMGPSGSGKSSLLNTLTGFSSVGTTGAIMMNGQERKAGQSQFRKQACYILQMDHLPAFFSVRELMHIAVALKLGCSLPPKAVEMLIDEILDTLGLSSCNSTRCNRLSGGQKKRLSIALELVDNPPLIFLDEPTTGLDSSSTTQCISLLKGLARGGRTVVGTFHQPSATIFKMFDHVYLLAEGHCTYQGSSDNVVNYLASCGFYCPKYHNPADFMLEVASGEHGQSIPKLVQSSKIRNWRGKEIVIPNNGIVKEQGLKSANAEDKTMVFISKPSEWSRFWTVLNRNCISLCRDWTMTHVKLCFHIMVGIVFGLLFMGTGNDGHKTFSNMGYLCACILYTSYTSMMPAVLRYPLEMEIMRKEWFNNWYSVKTYYAASMISSMPLQMLYCLVFALISYFMTEQPYDWTRFIKFTAILILVTLVAEASGILFGISFHITNGMFFGSVMIAFVLLFSGYLILLDDIPDSLRWLSYVSYLRFGMEGLVVTLYGESRNTLPCSELYCHLRSPKKALVVMGMQTSNYWIDVVALIILVLLIRGFSFFYLKRKIKIAL